VTLAFPAKYEKKMYWFLLGLTVIFFILCLALNRKFPELEVENDIPVMASGNILFIIYGWICIKIIAKRAKMQNNPLLYHPIVLGLGFIIVGCSALTFTEFFGSPFVFCSYGLIFTSFGIRLWRKNKILSHKNRMSFLPTISHANAVALGKRFG
jgi:vacuolar-type H+-ATPase subunit I/STV1